MEVLAGHAGLLWTVLVVLAIVALLLFIVGRGRWHR
jgi:hypothetical protein